TEGDHLRLRPLLDRDLRRIDVEDAGRGRVVDVLARLERGDEPWVSREVRDAAQLDLVVVRDQQLASGRRDERLAERTAELAAHRNVVQVRRVRAQPAGAGHGLVEGRVDATVGLYLTEEAFAIGRAQFLDLAVAQEVVDDRM